MRGSRCTRFLALVLGVVAAASPVRAAAISVSLSRPFFNPSLGQKMGISLDLATPGSIDVVILDRDGFLIRRLVSGKPAKAGRLTLDWDGRDYAGVVVSDEAYSIKADLASAGTATSYFPADSIAEESFPRATSFDRQRGILVYELTKPSRVHIQAGTSVLDPRTKEESGPCLKTIANREPRSAGQVIEYWKGFDESGSIYVPDLPNFALSLVATDLPDNSIIAIGNRSRSFLDDIGRRGGTSLFTIVARNHGHHRGLTTLKDVAPKLLLEPLNATWSSTERLWRVRGNKLTFRMTLTGPSAREFAAEPGGITVFVDEIPFRAVERIATDAPVEVTLPTRPDSPHRIEVNWISDFGPVAANALRVTAARPGSAATASRGTR